MNTTATNDTEMIEMIQTLMNEGTQGFPAVAARMYNLAMQFERELHLGAGRYERTEGRTGYANGYKPKTLQTAAGKLRLRIPQVRDSERPFCPKVLDGVEGKEKEWAWSGGGGQGWEESKRNREWKVSGGGLGKGLGK